MDAFILQILNGIQDFRLQVGIFLQPKLGGLGHDVRTARQFAHQNSTSIPHGFGSDVLVAVSDPINRVNMHAALVSKRAGTDERLTIAEVHVGHFIDVPRNFRQVNDAAVHQHFMAHLKAQVGSH